jgi:DNA-binding beta-propeller fold protein YncE
VLGQFVAEQAVEDDYAALCLACSAAAATLKRGNFRHPADEADQGRAKNDDREGNVEKEDADESRVGKPDHHGPQLHLCRLGQRSNHRRHVLWSQLNEPQGVAYDPQTDTVFVANGGDGTVRSFRGEDFVATARLEIGSGADNIRVDGDPALVYVGYGWGALAFIDPFSRARAPRNPTASVVSADPKSANVAMTPTSRGPSPRAVR